LPVAAITSTRLAGVNVLADLGDNHADNPVGRRPQHGLVEPPFEHRERGRRRLDLRVRDCALLFGRGPATAASWLAYALAMSARALATSFSAWSSACHEAVSLRAKYSVRLSCCSA
jgi:hypothetical protein